MAVRARVTVPASAPAGSVVEVRTLIAHAMESGLRVDGDGRRVPQDLIRRFTCHLDQELLFSADLHAAIAANPFLSFSWVARRSGTLRFTWSGDRGFAHTETVVFTVS